MNDQLVAEAATYTKHTTEGHSYSQRDSNPSFQPSSSCRPTPYTARSPGTAQVISRIINIFSDMGVKISRRKHEGFS
jgi:hypothetical protein